MPQRIPSRPLRRALTLAAGLSAASALVLAGVPAAHAGEPTTPIPHSKPTWLASAKKLGAPRGSAAISARVYLAPKGGLDALTAAAIAVSTPGSPTYGRFLSTAQYQAAFGTPTSVVQQVESYLRGAGLTVQGVEAHNRYIAVSGNVAAAQKAFSTTIGRYHHDGTDVQAPAEVLAVPRSIAGMISTVTGLDTTPRRVTPAAATPAPPPAGFRNGRPCSAFHGQLAAKYQADFKTPLPKFQGKTLPYAVCGYTGPQLRAAYEGTTALDGSGVTVAITDAYAAPTIAADANRYATSHGDGAYRRGQLAQVTPRTYTDAGPDECDAPSWFGEETLDVEAVHAMAPGANIRYYAARSCSNDDFLVTLAKVIDENRAKLVTNSWSGVEEDETAESVAAYEQVFLQGAMQGISFLFSSGDRGDELAATGVKQVDYPASDPYATSVGGTSDAIGPDGSFLYQTGWGTQTYSPSDDGRSWSPGGFLYGAGGGTSALFNKPSYQNGTVAGGARQVPDAAMDADANTGMLIGETQTFSDGVAYDEYRIGGTSLASPLLAGLTALSFQRAGHSVGLLNPTIYKSKSAFTDIKGRPGDAGVVRVNYVNGENADDGLAYVVRTFDQDSSLATKPGYDTVTGVGSPTPRWLTAIR